MLARCFLSPVVEINRTQYENMKITEHFHSLKKNKYPKNNDEINENLVEKSLSSEEDY